MMGYACPLLVGLVIRELGPKFYLRPGIAATGEIRPKRWTGGFPDDQPGLFERTGFISLLYAWSCAHGVVVAW